MTGYFPKRRKNAGPNKNEKKIQRAEDERRQGSRILGSTFPAVRRVAVHLKFVNPQQVVIGEDQRSFGPSDPFDFSAPCPGACGEGTFNLEARVAQAVEAHEALAEASGKCQKQKYGSSDPCGCELKCRIEITYN